MLHKNYSRHKNFGRCSAGNCNFPVLLNEGENSLLKKWLSSSKGTYMREKKEKFCNKLSMKVKAPVEFNSKKYNLS